MTSDLDEKSISVHLDEKELRFLCNYLLGYIPTEFSQELYFKLADASCKLEKLKA